MNQKSTIAIVIACIVSLVTSTIALCLSIPRSQELNFDYLGLLVGIQSLIVTLLLGWNIYCLIDIKSIRAEMQGIKQTSKEIMERNCYVVCHTAGDVYYRNLVGANPCGDDYFLIYYRISEIYHASNFGDYETCRLVIDTLLQMFPKPRLTNFRPSQMKTIFSLLSNVKGKDKIPNYEKFVYTIAQMSDEIH